MCSENIEWAKNENRTFLRQALEVSNEKTIQFTQNLAQNIFFTNLGSSNRVVL